MTRFASCVGQSWSGFWKRLTSYSYAGVEAMPILLIISYHSGQIILWPGQPLWIWHISWLKADFVKFCNMSQNNLKFSIHQWELGTLSFWSSDTIWWQRSGSTLAQVMLVAWWHQAITWTNVDWSSVKSSDSHIRSISQQMPQPSITKIRYKYTFNFPSVQWVNLVGKMGSWASSH